MRSPRITWMMSMSKSVSRSASLIVRSTSGESSRTTTSVRYSPISNSAVRSRATGMRAGVSHRPTVSR
ncbi:hypothetical protein BRC92_06705 [Halobacteriales archaeon QS_4_69_31]|nr:MAG: hypothetical protein BRC92_06705 [Halobacteriales archaeon QS_4_69_31]